MTKTSTITVERVKQLLTYNPETGEFFWNARGIAHVDVDKAGKIAGHFQSDNYIRITIDGVKILAHRAAYAVMTGVWPTHQVDHIDGNKSNNKWSNLRHATNKLNCANRGKQKRNTSGYKGVYLTKRGKYEAGIRVNYKYHHLGTFNTAEDAYAAYCNAAERLNGEFAHL